MPTSRYEQVKRNLGVHAGRVGTPASVLTAKAAQGVVMLQTRAEQ